MDFVKDKMKLLSDYFVNRKVWLIVESKLFVCIFWLLFIKLCIIDVLKMEKKLLKKEMILIMIKFIVSIVIVNFCVSSIYNLISIFICIIWIDCIMWMDLYVLVSKGMLRLLRSCVSKFVIVIIDVRIVELVFFFI